MKKILFVSAAVLTVAILALTAKSLIFWGRSVSINDVTEKASIVLAGGKEKVHSIRLLITGELDGQAIIQQNYLEKYMYRYKLDPGQIYLPINTDWYNNICVIEYEPKGVKSGKLKIRYDFKAR